MWTREQLLTRVWGDSAYRDPRTVDVHIRHLREKLEADTGSRSTSSPSAGSATAFATRTTAEPAAPARSRAMRSLANRLALIFFLITLGAMTIVYVGVVPHLESSLVSDRSDRLGRAADRTTPPIARAIDSNAPVAEVDRLVRSAADQANARVTLLGVNRGSFGTQPFVKSDSNANADIRDLEFPAVEAAIQSGRAERATESGRDGRVVELALPLFFRDAAGHRLLGSVAVYSAPLEDVQRTSSSCARAS